MEALCRLCLSRDCHIKSISDYEFQKNRPGELQQLIEEATGIQIEQDDLAKGLCTCCAGMVVSVVKFRRKCQKINMKMQCMRQESLKEEYPAYDEEFLWNYPENTKEEIEYLEYSVTEVAEVKDIEIPPPESPDSLLGDHELNEEDYVNKWRKKKKPPGKVIFPKDPGLCDICGKHFSYIRSHKLAHMTYMKHECGVCGKRFRTSSNLRKHEKYHEEPQFSCEICGKRMYSKVKLKYHIMTHTDERPFACQVCQKGFRDKKHLVVHFRIHTGEKPYVCPICDARYTTLAGLSQHRKHNHRPIA
ncbi:zinc finger protein 570-like [Lutzomyia longipalpis]|uniref:zinc finger protein 570-like n=1 Tax=Lutzomyia longipalpis TaxID=7200 RepID=UPI0024840C18|nr:zinc finger protein 570-like [Lutzomyia longipalpis]